VAPNASIYYLLPTTFYSQLCPDSLTYPSNLVVQLVFFFAKSLISTDRDRHHLDFISDYDILAIFKTILHRKSLDWRNFLGR